MFDIKQNDRFDDIQRLLYNIWQELKRLNEKNSTKAETKLSEIHFDDCTVVGLIEDLKREIEDDEATEYLDEPLPVYPENTTKVDVQPKKIEKTFETPKTSSKVSRNIKKKG